MAWRLRITRRAEREMDRIPDRDAAAIRTAIERLAANPGATDIKKLSGHDAEWRIRVGRWRVILAFDNSAGLITVERVVPRDRAYRD